MVPNRRVLILHAVLLLLFYVYSYFIYSTFILYKKLDVKAADGGGSAVTGITFLDGNEDDLYVYNHQQINFEDESCVCCFDDHVEVKYNVYIVDFNFC